MDLCIARLPHDRLMITCPGDKFNLHKFKDFFHFLLTILTQMHIPESCISSEGQALCFYGSVGILMTVMWKVHHGNYEGNHPPVAQHLLQQSEEQSFPAKIQLSLPAWHLITNFLLLRSVCASA